MKYFYEYKYKNGPTVGGHNLENILIKDNLIKLSGVDVINYASEPQEQYWGTTLDMNKIEYLKIMPMIEEDSNEYR